LSGRRRDKPFYSPDWLLGLRRRGDLALRPKAEPQTRRTARPYGRGAGVGQGRGVGAGRGVDVGLGVEVAVAVAVGVAVAVAVAVGVAVAVAVGVGLGVKPLHKPVTVRV